MAVGKKLPILESFPFRIVRSNWCPLRSSAHCSEGIFVFLLSLSVCGLSSRFLDDAVFGAKFLATHWILKAARRDVRGGGREAGQVAGSGAAALRSVTGTARPPGHRGSPGPACSPTRGPSSALHVLNRPLSSPVCPTSASGNSCHRTGLGHGRPVDVTGRGALDVPACALCPRFRALLTKRVRVCVRLTQGGFGSTERHPVHMRVLGTRPARPASCPERSPERDGGFGSGTPEKEPHHAAWGRGTGRAVPWAVPWTASSPPRRSCHRRPAGTGH